MGKTKKTTKKISKQRQRKAVSKKALAHVAKLAQVDDAPLSGKIPKQANLNSALVNDTGPFPTEDNGNSHDKTYLEVTTKIVENEVTEKRKTTTFHIVRDLLHQNTTINDDDTVIHGLNKSKYSNIRVSVMCAIPSKDVEEDEAPFEGIRKMNRMVKSLINKIPSVKLAVWNPASGSSNTFLKELPEDVDVVEKYAHDFNRFISPGKNLYCRLNLFFNPNKTSISEIDSVIAGFRKPRVQFMSLAHSDAISPCQMGFFTGSVKAMAESSDFSNSFKKFFKLSNLGLWWAYPKSDLGWTKDNKKWALHYEIDRSDVNNGRNDKIIEYFAKHSSLVDDNFFGTPMSLVPMFTPFLEDDLKLRISKHAQKQATIGSNLKSITLGGTQILNWTNKKKETTLHRQLMCVESIYNKTVVRHDKDKKQNTFKGRLFYAIIPNQKTKLTTFYFSSANTDEARSVATGLPLFIRDHFKIKPSFFCGSDEVTKCLEGEWDFLRRIFLTPEEKDEKDKFAHLIDTVTAVKDKYISQAHKAAMCTEEDDAESIDTRLTKDDDAQPEAASTSTDDVSNLTGETRESKAKAYAAEESKKVALQYIDTMDNMKSDHMKELEEMKSTLAAALLQLGINQKGENDMIDEISAGSKKDDELANKEIDISSTEYDGEKSNSTSMSGLSLSLSSSSDDGPIMTNIRKTRRARIKRVRESSQNKKSDSDSPRRKSSRHATSQANKVTPGKNDKRNSGNKRTPAVRDSSGDSL